MVDKLRKLADWERDWGALARWLLSIVFFLAVYSLLHFADIHYVRRDEFGRLTDKLDALIVGQATTNQHVLDIERRLDRMDDRQNLGQQKREKIAGR